MQLFDLSTDVNTANFLRLEILFSVRGQSLSNASNALMFPVALKYCLSKACHYEKRKKTPRGEKMGKISIRNIEK
jgi:hypothetical protein